jgi:hypothetical protein
VSAAHGIGLPFKRSTITESDFIERTIDGKEKREPVEYAGEIALSNVPRSWVQLQAGVGLLTGKLHGAIPAKIEDDAYVSDPIGRTATIAGASFHAPFDATTPQASPAERIGFVAGAVLTPAAGIYLGPSFGWRGFSLTVGSAWMWVHTPADSFAVGDDVKKKADGGPEEQLKYGRVRAWLIGGTYVFGK